MRIKIPIFTGLKSQVITLVFRFVKYIFVLQFFEKMYLLSMNNKYIFLFFLDYWDSGRSVVWLARLLWEQEVAGSNPAAPTTECWVSYFKILNIRNGKKLYNEFRLARPDKMFSKMSKSGRSQVLPKGLLRRNPAAPIIIVLKIIE